MKRCRHRELVLQNKINYQSPFKNIPPEFQEITFVSKGKPITV